MGGVDLVVTRTFLLGSTLAYNTIPASELS
jgi:hypothetical protein